MAKSGKTRAKLILERVQLSKLKPASYNLRIIIDEHRAGLSLRGRC